MDNIHQRLAKVQQKLSYIQKEKKRGMQYSIVSHDAVTAAVRPLMVENGIIYYPCFVNHEQSGNRTEVMMAVRFVNVDEPKDFIDVATLGYGVDNSDKGPGKAMSYAVKYALLKCLGLETGDDPDHDQDTVHTPDESAKPKSSAALKREDVWGEFEAALGDVENLVQLESLKIEYRAKAAREGWNASFMDAMKNAFLVKEEAINQFNTQLEAAE